MTTDDEKQAKLLKKEKKQAKKDKKKKDKKESSSKKRKHENYDETTANNPIKEKKKKKKEKETKSSNTDYKGTKFGLFKDTPFDAALVRALETSFDKPSPIQSAAWQSHGRNLTRCPPLTSLPQKSQRSDTDDLGYLLAFYAGFMTVLWRTILTMRAWNLNSFKESCVVARSLVVHHTEQPKLNMDHIQHGHTVDHLNEFGAFAD